MDKAEIKRLVDEGRARGGIIMVHGIATPEIQQALRDEMARQYREADMDAKKAEELRVWDRFVVAALDVTPLTLELRAEKEELAPAAVDIADALILARRKRMKEGYGE